MRVLQAETTAGTGTPTAIADSILNITGVGWALRACGASPSFHLFAPHLFSSSLPQPLLSVLPPFLSYQLPSQYPHLSSHAPHLQVTSSTWPAQTCRTCSPQSWGLSHLH